MGCFLQAVCDGMDIAEGMIPRVSDFCYFLPILENQTGKREDNDYEFIRSYGLTHSFGENYLFKNADFTLNKGEHMGLSVRTGQEKARS